MRKTFVVAFSIAASGAVHAQDFTPEFYAGVLAGVAPTFSTPGQFWNSDSAIFSAGAFGGVNFLSGTILYGLELGMSGDMGKTSGGEWRRENSIAPLPRLVYSGTCWGCAIPPGGIDRTETLGGQAADGFLSYSYGETLARPTVSARYGFRHENWTLYGKAGIGASYQRYTDVSDASGTVNCRAIAQETRWTPSAGTTSYEAWATECLDPQQGKVTKMSREAWTPTVTYGLGFEYDFEPYFARGEVEMTQVLNTSGTVRANAGLGIRF